MYIATLAVSTLTLFATLSLAANAVNPSQYDSDTVVPTKDNGKTVAARDRMFGGKAPKIHHLPNGGSILEVPNSLGRRGDGESDGGHDIDPDGVAGFEHLSAVDGNDDDEVVTPMDEINDIYASIRASPFSDVSAAAQARATEVTLPKPAVRRRDIVATRGEGVRDARPSGVGRGDAAVAGENLAYDGTRGSDSRRKTYADQ